MVVFPTTSTTGDNAVLPQDTTVAGETDWNSKNRGFVTRGSLLDHLPRPLAHVICGQAFPLPENLRGG